MLINGKACFAIFRCIIFVYIISDTDISQDCFVDFLKSYSKRTTYLLSMRVIVGRECELVAAARHKTLKHASFECGFQIVQVFYLAVSFMPTSSLCSTI